LRQDTDNDYDRQILQVIASGGRITQRSLAGDLGVALGLANLLIRRVAGKGYIKVSGVGTRHVRYLMTANGWEALAQATRASMANTVHLYTQTREQIRVSLAALAEECVATSPDATRVVFYGAGDVAEIAYVSMQRTDLRLVGVVDDRKRGRFFEHTICQADDLTPESLNGTPYSTVIVATLRHGDAIQARLRERGIPRDRVFSL
jgi:DNA-binding MarR family transcriptional regulator